MDEIILIKDHSKQEGYTDIQKFLFSCDCKWRYSLKKQEVLDLDEAERIFVVSLSDGMISHRKTRRKMKDYNANVLDENVVGMYSFRDHQKEIAYKIHNYDNDLVIDDNTKIFLTYERWERLKDTMNNMDDIRRHDKALKITDMEFDLVKETVMSQKYYWCERIELNRLYHKYKDDATKKVV